MGTSGMEAAGMREGEGVSSLGAADTASQVRSCDSSCDMLPVGAGDDCAALKRSYAVVTTFGCLGLLA